MSVVPRPNQLSLHVADLKPNVTESLLFEFFRRVGEIPSVRVCRDSSTNVSLGYGYVNFTNEKDASKALETLNNEPIDGRPCRVSWSSRDPSSRKSTVGNLYIKNIDKGVEQSSFYDIFANFGEILSCKLQTDLNGEPRGFGFVHFKKAEDAQSAIDSMNGKFVNEKQIFVGPFIPKSQRPNTSRDQFTNIFLKQFDPSLGLERFAELVQKATADCGKITSPFLATISVEVDGKTVTQSRGFGFANYETHEGAQKALERLKDSEKVRELAPELLLPETDLYVNVAMSKAARAQSHPRVDGNLYIKNIADVITEERLKELFAPFGPITSVKIMTHEDSGAAKTSKGFGFVCFADAAHARAAVTTMHNRSVENKPLYVAPHQPRAIRQQQLAIQHQQHSMMQPYGFPGMPPNRAYPMQRNLAPRGGPRGFGQPYGNRPHYPIMPQPTLVPSQGGLREKLKDTPEDSKVQAAGDYIFAMLISWGHDEATARKLTGMILGNVHNKPIGETLNLLCEFCDDPAKLQEEVQKLKALAIPMK